MKRYFLVGLVMYACMYFIVVPVANASGEEIYRFRQWIAPKECVENKVVNGVDTQIFLTPSDCNQLLHPPQRPQTTPANPTSPTSKPNNFLIPGVPNTGYGAVAVGLLFGIVSMLILLVAIRIVQRLVYR